MCAATTLAARDGAGHLRGTSPAAPLTLCSAPSPSPPRPCPGPEHERQRVVLVLLGQRAELALLPIHQNQAGRRRQWLARWGRAALRGGVEGGRERWQVGAGAQATGGRLVGLECAAMRCLPCAPPQAGLSHPPLSHFCLPLRAHCRSVRPHQQPVAAGGLCKRRGARHLWAAGAQRTLGSPRCTVPRRRIPAGAAMGAWLPATLVDLTSHPHGPCLPLPRTAV